MNLLSLSSRFNPLSQCSRSESFFLVAARWCSAAPPASGSPVQVLLFRQSSVCLHRFHSTSGGAPGFARWGSLAGRWDTSAGSGYRGALPALPLWSLSPTWPGGFCTPSWCSKGLSSDSSASLRSTLLEIKVALPGHSQVSKSSDSSELPPQWRCLSYAAHFPKFQTSTTNLRRRVI